MATTAVAFLLSFVVITVVEGRAFEEQIANRLATEAEIVAATSEAALASGDLASARQALASLAKASHVLEARLYSVAGLVAEYRRGPAHSDAHGGVWSDAAAGRATDAGNTEVGATPSGGPVAREPSVRAPSASEVASIEYLTDTIVTRVTIRHEGAVVGSIELVADQRALYAELWNNGRTVALVLLIALVGAYFLATGLGRSVVRPIVQLMEVAKRISTDKDYTTRAAQTGGGEVSGLIASFNHMLDEIENRDSALSSANEAIKAKETELSLMLHSLNQGVFTVNVDGEVVGEHSRRAESIFGTDDLQRSTLGDLLRASPHTIGLLKQWIGLMKKPRFRKQWTRNLRLNPLTEVEFADDEGTRIIELDYQPITSSDGRSLERVMVLATDVTTQRRSAENLEFEQREHEAQMARILALTSNDRPAAEAFIDRADELLRLKLAGLDARMFSQSDVEAHYRLVHTLRGNAGTFGFTGLGEVAGDLEEIFDSMREGSAAQHRLEQEILDEADGERRMKTSADWDSVLGAMRQELDKIRSAQKRLYGGREDQLSIDADSYLELLKGARDGQTLPAEELAERLEALDAQPFVAYRDRYDRLVSYYRETRAKALAPLVFEGDGSAVPRRLMNIFGDCLVHLLRNALDHGIEGAHQRRELGKGPGTITMRHWNNDRTHTIVVSDDGAGIRPEAVARIAVARYLITAQEAQQLSDSEKIRLICRPGFSSVGSVTDMSGKGVGMDAVQELLRRYGGELEIKSVVGQGTQMTIRLPCGAGSSRRDLGGPSRIAS